MSRLHATAACMLAAVVCAVWLEAHGAESDIVEYRGMRIDFHLTTRKQRQIVMPSLEKQIDVALSVHVPPEVLAFFHSVPIVVDAAMLSNATNGEYIPNEGASFVRMKPIELPEERAIVLHELMHAYHHQVLKMGTPDIRGAFERAKLKGVYPDDYRNAAFLTNYKEYFANVATTFLLGKSERPPFSCAIVEKAQPKFIGYLSTLFGPQNCGP